MPARDSIRRLVAVEKPLITPLAYDALSARLITRAGFKSIGIGGSGMLAARYGLPDVGLAALGEMAAGTADIVAATDLPVMVDGDDGSGDVMSVAHMMDVYGRLGVSAIVLEDQMRDGKQPGDGGATAVVAAEAMVRKLKAAAAARTDAELTIIARCDAYKLESIDGAMRRAEQYLKAGADGVFIPAVQQVEELATIGKRFRGAHLVAAIFEGRNTWLPPSQLYEMGFRQIVCPALLMTRVVHALDVALRQFHDFVEGKAPMPAVDDAEGARTALEEAVTMRKWKALHARFHG
jgi:2-methylisocitrate lyase-like PEP mutase family enzyme